MIRSIWHEIQPHGAVAERYLVCRGLIGVWVRSEIVLNRSGRLASPLFSCGSLGGGGSAHSQNDEEGQEC